MPLKFISYAWRWNNALVISVNYNSIDCELVAIKEALYRIWCGVNRLGDSGVKRLSDISAFVNTVGQLLLNGQGKTRMDGIGIVFEFYNAPL